MFQTEFGLTVRATEDLFTNAGSRCGVEVLKKTFSAGQTAPLNGGATSRLVGNVWVPQVRDFDRSLFGEPRSHFSPGAVISGTDDAKAELAEACGAEEKEQKAIRDTLLGTWKGHYVGCPGATLESEEVIIKLDKMNDLNTFSGTETWPHATLTSPCERVLGGNYTPIDQTLHLTPGELVNPAPVCLPLQARDFKSTVSIGQKEITFIPQFGKCHEIHVEKQ